MKQRWNEGKGRRDVRLGDFEDLFFLRIIRNGAFLTPGFLSDPQDGMLVFLEERKLLERLQRTPRISGVITTEELTGDLRDIPCLAVSANPRRSFFLLHNHLALNTDFYWKDFPSEIHKSARIHPTAAVAGKNVRIGPHTVIEAHATIAERCLIGSGVTIRAGAVLGSVGFQTGITDEGMMDMVHAGGILVQDRVHILSNAVIAAAVFRQFTSVGEDSRVGNLAFLSHNVQVGPRCFVGHGAVVCGNTRLGEEVWIGPGATVSNNLQIGDRGKVSLGAAVVGDVPPDARVTGNIAIDHHKWLRHMASIK